MALHRRPLALVGLLDALDHLREALFSGIKTELEKHAITFDDAGSRSFSSPRRLAVLIASAAASQPDQVQERRGPAVEVAFDDTGKPSGAAVGFARSVGKEVAELETISTDKGEWLFARQHIPGKPLSELIYPVLEQAIKTLPVPRPMRWSDHDFSFVRPVHWLIVMHGTTILPGSLLGKPAGNLTRGHRVHSPGPHRVEQPAEYLATLTELAELTGLERNFRVSDALIDGDGSVQTRSFPRRGLDRLEVTAIGQSFIQALKNLERSEAPCLQL